MNKPDAIKTPDDEVEGFLDNLQYPEDYWETGEEDERRTLQAFDDWKRTGMAVPLEDVEAWMKARRTNPNAPRPTPRKLT